MIIKLVLASACLMLTIFISFYFNKQFEQHIEQFIENVPKQTSFAPIYDKLQEKVKIIQEEVDYQDIIQLVQKRFQEFSVIMAENYNFYLEQVVKLFVQRKKQHIDKFKYYHNFAALFGGATIVDKNDKAHSPKNLLSDNKDQYMLNECKEDNKFVTIMLKEDVTVEAFAIINSEFYSSNVKDIEVYGSQNFPTEEWMTLGIYKAADENMWQFFDLKNVWVRFIKFQFKSYYGSEYYCPITQIKVFGSTILQDLQSEINSSFQNDQSDFKNQKNNIKSISNNQQQSDQQNKEIMKLQENEQNSKKREIVYETSEDELDFDDDIGAFNEEQQQLMNQKCIKSWKYVEWYNQSVQTEIQESINYNQYCQQYGDKYFVNYKDVQEIVDDQYEKIEKQCLYMDMSRYFVRKLKKQCVPVQQTQNEMEQEEQQKNIKQQSILKTLTQHIKQIEGYQKEQQLHQNKYQTVIDELLEEIKIEKGKNQALTQEYQGYKQYIDKQNIDIQKLSSQLQEQLNNQKTQTQEGAIIVIAVSIISIIVLFLLGVFIQQMIRNKNLENSLTGVKRFIRKNSINSKQQIFKQKIIDQNSSI